MLCVVSMVTMIVIGTDLGAHNIVFILLHFHFVNVHFPNLMHHHLFASQDLPCQWQKKFILFLLVVY
jgi:hypothetical protein